jgi:hypothetical protein
MYLSEIHPWLGTQHCLRDCESWCRNDHTGCLWNDGHNECLHPTRAPKEGSQSFDSPLLKRSPEVYVLEAV